MNILMSINKDLLYKWKFSKDKEIYSEGIYKGIRWVFCEKTYHQNSGLFFYDFSFIKKNNEPRIGIFLCHEKDILKNIQRTIDECF